jgi:hypothetical protein
LLLNKLKRKARGFGFVTFDSQEAADKVLDKSFHELRVLGWRPKIMLNQDVQWSGVLGVIGSLLTARTECTH